MYDCRPRSTLLASGPRTGGCSSPILVPVPQPHACPPRRQEPPQQHTGAILLRPPPPASCKPASAPQPTLTHGHLVGKMLFQGLGPSPLPRPGARLWVRLCRAPARGWQRWGAAAGLAGTPSARKEEPPAPCGANASCSPAPGSSPSPSTTALSSETPRWGFATWSVQLHFRIYLK